MCKCLETIAKQEKGGIVENQSTQCSVSQNKKQQRIVVKITPNGKKKQVTQTVPFCPFCGERYSFDQPDALPFFESDQTPTPNE